MLDTKTNRITWIVPPHLKYTDYVNPSSAHKAVVKKDEKKYGNLITDMPLGPMAMSSYLKNLNITSQLLDFNVELNRLDEFNYESFIDYFHNYFVSNLFSYDDSDIFGISCLFSPSYQSLIDIAKVIKKIFPNHLIMAGGNIPSNMYREIYEIDDSIDLICYGEGELPLKNYFNAEAKDDYIAKSDSWITKEKLKNNDFVPSHDFIWDLDEIPIYDYNLCRNQYFDNPAFTAYGNNQEKDANYHILTSRGCPYHCIFCAAHKVHGRKMRYYSVERVKEDLSYLKEKFGVKTLIFQDDHFMGDKERALEIVKYVGELGVKIIFQNSLALYALKKEFLKACKKAGMNQLVLSVESGSDRVLRKVMKKPLKLSIVEQVIEDCRDLDIYTYCNIVIGLPGETKDDIEDTRKFLKTTYANWFGIFCANPLVGSEMFDICVENDFLQNNWIGSDYKQAVVSTDDWSSEYIQQKSYELNLELNFVYNSDYRLGNYQLALDGFERAIRAKNDHAIAYYMASRCLYKLNNIDKAIIYSNKSQQICDKVTYWKNYMSKYSLDPFEIYDSKNIHCNPSQDIPAGSSIDESTHAFSVPPGKQNPIIHKKK